MLGDGQGKAKVAELQRQGVVPLAPLATRAWIVAGVSGIILVLGERVRENLLLNPLEWSAVQSEPGRMLEPLLMAVGILSAVTVVVAVLTTMPQTRGAARLSVLRVTGRGTTKEWITRPLQILFVAVLAFFGAYWLLPQMLNMMGLALASQIQGYFAELVAKVCKLVVVAAVVLAILVTFGSRAAFLFRHRKRDDEDS